WPIALSHFADATGRDNSGSFEARMITLNKVQLRRGSKMLLDGASVTLNPGEKVGLVGRNGAGKSSLFALFNGSLHEDGGDFSIPRQWRMAQVAQEMPETSESATQFVLTGDTRLVELRQALAAAEGAHEADPDDHDAGMALAHAYTDLAAALRWHDDRDQPRPRVSRRGDRRHAAHRQRATHAIRRQLQQVRGHARAADGAAATGIFQAAGQDRAPAEIHRPLQGQGQQ